MNDVLLNNVLNKIETNNRLLFVWSGKNVPENFQSIIERFQSKIGPDVKLNVEHLERLNLSNYEPSTFDCIVSNLLSVDGAENDSDTLAKYLKLLKPKGFLIAFDKLTVNNLEIELKLNGYLNLHREQSDSVQYFYAEKPNFEVGQTRKLKFASKVVEQQQQKQPQQQQKMWQFSADDVQEDDLINTDDLLDELDLKKPVQLDNFDCGTSKEGKKKACKNCSCGLAEELENEALDKQNKNVQSSNFKSACGSCYLGDAFRCASCPYLGMPAFKPGEKVQLNDFNKADI
jgi:hypothetical protein